LPRAQAPHADSPPSSRPARHLQATRWRQHVMNSTSSAKAREITTATARSDATPRRDRYGPPNSRARAR
jgi:hypothetical protein